MPNGVKLTLVSWSYGFEGGGDLLSTFAISLETYYLCISSLPFQNGMTCILNGHQ